MRLDVAKRAYLACNGTGYGRVDLRTSTPDSIDDVMVLEVNAQCGLGFEKDSSSLAEILILSQIKPHTFLTDLLETARARAKRP
jgi:D-alanine-D-alanine ligase-like ATP-grasp enzyme